MTAFKNLLHSADSLEAFSEKQDLTTFRSISAKFRQEVAMSYNEDINHRAQQYYNKASGCSVKPQKDNLFDYECWSKMKSESGY